MEIMAAYQAVLHFEDDPRIIRIVADSTYVVKCFNDGWWRGWHKRGWKNSQRQPVANRDLWEPFIELVINRGRVEFEWVKGHSGNRMNDYVDALAVAHTQI
jgi:ribonuclease HI